jgi:hypothetical protein
MPLPPFLKSRIEALCPTFVGAVRALRNRAYFRSQFTGLHSEIAALLFPSNSPVEVVNGPFKGMKYINEIVWGSITPKWLGSYEVELQPILEKIIGSNYNTIIDVGCAEGYYAVGMARAVPGAKVFVFDTDYISRKQVSRLAALNKVEARFHLGKWCGHDDLNRIPSGKTLVICDIEGFEAMLLDPTHAPGLLRCDILVEVHEEDNAPGRVEQTLMSRFTPSHRIALVKASDREEWITAHAELLQRCGGIENFRRATDENRSKGGALAVDGLSGKYITGLTYNYDIILNLIACLSILIILIKIELDVYQST